MTLSPSTTPTAISRPPWARRLVAFLVATAVAVPLAGFSAPTPALADESPAGSAAITEGALVWGYKATFRNYVSESGRSVAGGATMDSVGIVTFPVTTGTFTEVGGTTDLSFAGSVHYEKYCGMFEWYEADECALDITFDQLRLVISATEQTLYAHVISREHDTGTAKGELVDLGVVPLARLAVGPADVSTAAGVTSWTGIQAALSAEAGIPVGYNQGTPLDSLAFSYSGPGGKPQLAESWTPAGTIALDEATRWLNRDRPNVAPPIDDLFVDDHRGVVHVVNSPGGVLSPTLQALDADTLEFLGDSGTFTNGAQTEGRASAFDPATGTIYIRASLAGAVHIFAATWKPESRTYETVQIDVLPSTLSLKSQLVWDSAGSRLVALSQIPTTAAQTISIWEEHDGQWERTDHELPVLDGYRYNRTYQVSNVENGFDVTSDGTFILPRTNVQTAANVAVLDPTALQITVNGDAVEVREIPGVRAPEVLQFASGYNGVVAGPDGRLAFFSWGRPDTLVLFAHIQNGEVVIDGAPVKLADHVVALAGVFEADGTFWAKDYTAGALYGYAEGQLISTFSHQDSARFAPIASGDGHRIYLAMRTQQVLSGVVLLERAGLSPTITAHPEEQTVSAGETAQFTAAASGSPEPTIQWQQRHPGSLQFLDIDGAQSASLDHMFALADNGSEIRAVFSNSAGSIATEPVTVTVLSAPVISQQPVSQTVQPGTSATFRVLASGNPEPTIQWQRFVDDEWVPVSGAGFEILDGTLIVRGAAESAQFRARVTNSEGDVYSTVASLTVQLPDGGEDGSITGLPNSTGARTTVTPGVELPASGTVKVSGQGFVKGENEAGAYILFGYVTKFPSASGSLGVGYDYLPGETNQRFVAWPDSETAGASHAQFDGDGGFTVDGLVAASSFTGASGATVNCLDNSVQCGVLTVGAHGGRDANLETFTPVYFEGQSPNITPRAPQVSSSPTSVTVTAGEDATFSAGATGWPIPTVQWQSKLPSAGDWVNIAGATTATYRVTEAQLGASGIQYRAVFSNSEGNATTAAATLTVKKPEPPKATQAGSLTWGVKASFRSYIVSPTAKGSISLSGASTSGGAFVFGQSSADWNADAGTGSAGYSGAVRFTGHSGVLDLTLANPAITVTSPSSATLSISVNGSRITIGTVNLAAGTKSPVTGGVAYSGVPVTLTGAGAAVFSYGSSQFYAPGTAMDPVSFVIGANATGGSGGSTIASYTEDDDWTPPAEPPATEGIEGDPAHLADVHAGGELTVWADGFQPNEDGIKVVIYSDPQVLERNLTADASGRATWSGILPVDLEPGEHTLTFQGSVNRGIVLDVKPAQQLEGCTVDGATLTWGFKESFRAYIDGSIANGEWTVSDGATYDTPEFSWANGTGIYDPDTGAGLVTFTGTVRFTGHDGLLDTTIANPQLRFVDENTAYLLLDVAGVTMEDAMAGNTDNPVTVTAVPFVKLDLAGGDLEVADDGTITATGVPSQITSEGFDTFPNYEAGTAFDPVSFTIAPVDCADVATPDGGAGELENTSDSGPDLSWLLWVGLAVLVVAAIITTVLLLRRRHAA